MVKRATVFEAGEALAALLFGAACWLALAVTGLIPASNRTEHVHRPPPPGEASEAPRLRGRRTTAEPMAESPEGRHSTEEEADTAWADHLRGMLDWKTEEQWKALYGLYASYGQASTFRHFYDALLVRPMGLGSPGANSPPRGVVGSAPLFESVGSVRARAFVLNQDVRFPVPESALQILAYRGGARLEVIVGSALGGPGLSATDLAKYATAIRGEVFQHLDTSEADALVAIMEQYLDSCERAKYGIWTAIADLTETPGGGGSQVTPAAVLVRDWKLCMPQPQEWTPLDERLEQLAAVDEKMRRALEAVFK